MDQISISSLAVGMATKTFTRLSACVCNNTICGYALAAVTVIIAIRKDLIETECVRTCTCGQQMSKGMDLVLHCMATQLPQT